MLHGAASAVIRLLSYAGARLDNLPNTECGQANLLSQHKLEAPRLNT